MLSPVGGLDWRDACRTLHFLGNRTISVLQNLWSPVDNLLVFLTNSLLNYSLWGEASSPAPAGGMLGSLGTPQKWDELSSICQPIRMFSNLHQKSAFYWSYWRCGRAPTSVRWTVVWVSVGLVEGSAGPWQVPGGEAGHWHAFHWRSSRKSEFNETVLAHEACNRTNKIASR